MFTSDTRISTAFNQQIDDRFVTITGRQMDRCDALKTGRSGQARGKSKLIGNIVFFNLTPQGGAVDIEGRGGFAFIPVVFSQRI